MTSPISETVCVVHRLGLAIVNLHTTFEVSMIICNEGMKDNAKCNILVLSHPLGYLGEIFLRVNAQCSSMARWKAHC